VIRIYLTSEVRVEHGEVLLGERDWPGRQGRVVLAMLAAERDRPIARDVLADELWGDQPPEAFDKALMAVVSKLRAALRAIGVVDPQAASLGGLTF
jgi:DNA-binding SARP family transcriptional activator